MKIAAVQMDVQIGEISANLERMQQRLHEAVEAGAELVIFPECAVTGYCFDELEEARPLSQDVPGEATAAMISALRGTGAHALFGMLETDVTSVFNAAVLVNERDVVGTYRKIHLPHLGVDQFASYGTEPFQVYEIGDCRVGVGICYDSAFPESIRTMALLGADLIALPTNFPTGAELMTKHVLPTRAMENNVYFAGVNRVGKERGFRFIGESLIADPTGKVLQQADGTSETILYADIDPAQARDKRIVRVPGKHAIDRFADRRPEMYAELVKPHMLSRPRNDLKSSE